MLFINKKFDPQEFPIRTNSLNFAIFGRKKNVYHNFTASVITTHAIFTSLSLSLSRPPLGGKWKKGGKTKSHYQIFTRSITSFVDRFPVPEVSWDMQKRKQRGTVFACSAFLFYYCLLLFIFFFSPVSWNFNAKGPEFATLFSCHQGSFKTGCCCLFLFVFFFGLFACLASFFFFFFFFLNRWVWCVCDKNKEQKYFYFISDSFSRCLAFSVSFFLCMCCVCVLCVVCKAALAVGKCLNLEVCLAQCESKF